MKNLIQKKSKESDLAPQQLYGLYAMEQFVSQLSRTKYADYLIVKGGFLLTVTQGLENRATGDLDFTVNGFDLNKNNLIQMINSLDTIDTLYRFELKGLKETREKFEYNGFELKLIYHHDGVKIPFNVDFTTGEDLIEPIQKKKVSSVFSDEEYSILSYSLEQILTDKFYTLLAYGAIDDSNSRMKDYYDLYLLSKVNPNVDLEKINTGLKKTMKQRENHIDIKDYGVIINYLKESDKQKELWSRYSDIMPYAKGITFDKITDQILSFSNQLIREKQLQNDKKRIQQSKELER